jgi:hypothetical protein
MGERKEQLIYYLHNAVNILLTIFIFAMLYLIAAKVLENMTSLLNIITI